MNMFTEVVPGTAELSLSQHGRFSGFRSEIMMDLAVALLRLLPPEPAHHTTVWLASNFGYFLPRAKEDDPRLGIEVLGHRFANPIGLAAGFDKNASAYHALFKMGFGHIECGTVTPYPQKGNPGTRILRLREDSAVLNRMGFNNDGMEVVASRLFRHIHDGIIGINIGANRDSGDRIDDYRAAFTLLAPLAGYVAVNVSSPNTPRLRKLQSCEALHVLLETLVKARGDMKVPLLLKIAPDLEEAELDDIAAEVAAAGIEGLIVSNTTEARPSSLKSPRSGESGGLSGTPLFRMSTDVLRGMRVRLGPKYILIGVGGVNSGATAYEKIRAGASLVQIYTALIYHGPGLVARIKRDLLAYLERDGFSCIADAVGADVKP